MTTRHPRATAGRSGWMMRGGELGGNERIEYAQGEATDTSKSGIPRRQQQRIPVILASLCMPTPGFVEAPRACTHRAPVSGYLAGSVPVRLAVALVHKDFKSGSRTVMY